MRGLTRLRGGQADANPAAGRGGGTSGVRPTGEGIYAWTFIAGAAPRRRTRERR
jgi:hypothetical protein